MVKIKQKKTMNLPQLIEHIEQTDYEACVYQADDAPVYVRVGRIKGIHIEGSGTVFPHNTFTVEIEEEITEETKISKLAHYSVYGFKGNKNNTSINDVKDDNSIAFYIMNDDRTMTLIWTHDKGLVE
ncbi:hypothetical protein [Staphylococcus saprophyticus]|uniref:hypothetical protein n=1 Tax=Staphylococcus saprophyticus TaxID=29385 RepID=UPI0036E60B7F